MTVDEIKQQHSMREVVERYGIKINRTGFCSCPFHSGDRTPSMKIYKQDYHCHACGANGDIFSFIQGMDNCDFKTAFYSLGGTYEKPTFESKLAIYRANKAKERLNRRIQGLRKQKELVDFLIRVDVRGKLETDPLSDAWCYFANDLEYQLYVSNALQNEIKKGVN